MFFLTGGRGDDEDVDVDNDYSGRDFLKPRASSLTRRTTLSLTLSLPSPSSPAWPLLSYGDPILLVLLTGGGEEDDDIAVDDDYVFGRDFLKPRALSLLLQELHFCCHHHRGHYYRRLPTIMVNLEINLE
jgi:hypothetical protein